MSSYIPIKQFISSIKDITSTFIPKTSTITHNSISKSQSIYPTLKTSDPSENNTQLARCLRILAISHEPKLVSDFASFIQHSALSAGLVPSEVLQQPKYRIKRWSVMKSPFGHKDHWRQFEKRAWIKELEIYHNPIDTLGATETPVDVSSSLSTSALDRLSPQESSELVSRFVWYLKQNLPHDMQMEIQVTDHFNSCDDFFATGQQSSSSQQ